MSSPRTSYLLIIACVVVALGVSAVGQSANARLDGVVKDTSGGVVPGVAVTVTNEATNLSFETFTNDAGFFIFANLTPASYTLSCELPGFKRYSETKLKLDVGATVTQDITLETGNISEEIVVTSEVAQVDRVSQSLKTVVGERKIINLPLVDRNPLNLFFLQAGANRVSAGGAGRINGLRNTANNVQIEGIASNDPMLTGGATQSLAPIIAEGMAEYSVTNSSAAAENGLGSGSQIQLIYKSGGNDFHGSVWEFHRNRALNSNSFFNNRSGLDKPAFRRHQYGFAVGGPVQKDKAFFHFTYENTTQVQDATVNRTVYTDAFKSSGIFQYEHETTGAIETIDLTTIDPTRTGMSSIFTGFANSLPSPNNFDIGDGLNTGGFRFNSNDPLDDWRLILKGDYVISDKHRFSVTYADRRLDNPTEFHISGVRRSTNNEKYPAGVFTFTSNFTPNFLNELRLGGTKRDWKFDNPARSGVTTPLINFNGLGGPVRGTSANPSIFLPQQGPSATLTINNNVTWIRGDHTFKGGIDFRINRSNVAFGGDYYLPVVNTSSASNPVTIPDLDGLADADLGRAEQLTNDVTGTLGQLRQDFQQISPDGASFVPFETKLRRWRSREYSFFFQDTWRFRPNLTLQLGFRYEFLPPHFEDEGIFSYPVLNGQACVECIFGISGPGETQLGLLPEGGRELYPTDKNNFAPNIGFTWDPTGSGEWSIAANYRVAYDRNPLVNTLFQDFNQEGASTVQRFNGVGGRPLSDAEGISLGFDPGTPFGPKPFNRTGTVTVWDPNYATPYVQSWSLRVQREIMRNTVLELAYVGNHGVGLPRALDLNQRIVRENGFLDGFLVAQANLAASGDPLVGQDTGVFGQIWTQMTPGQQSGQLSNITRGEVAAVANFIDFNLGGDPLEAAGLPDNFFRVNPQFGPAQLLGNNSHSTFNGLRVDLRRRFSDGLQFQFNYALGKALTDYEGGQSQRNAFRDNLNQGLDKSRSAADARHIVNANVIYELPFGRGRRWANFSNGFLDAVLGGWQVNGILSYSSGQPFTIQSTGRNNLTTGDSSTATFLGDDPGITNSVNTGGDNVTFLNEEQQGLFEQPVAGSAGLTAQRFFDGPSFWVLDSSVFKRFRTPWVSGEDASLELRFEFFNTTNSTVFSPYGAAQTNINSGSFGNVTATRSPRIMQVALKFIF